MYVHIQVNRPKYADVNRVYKLNDEKVALIRCRRGNQRISCIVTLYPQRFFLKHCIGKFAGGRFRIPFVIAIGISLVKILLGGVVFHTKFVSIKTIAPRPHPIILTEQYIFLNEDLRFFCQSEIGTSKGRQRTTCLYFNFRCVGQNVIRKRNTQTVYTLKFICHQEVRIFSQRNTIDKDIV